MDSEDFEPDTAETAVVEQKETVDEQAEISSKHFEAAEPVTDRN